MSSIAQSAITAATTTTTTPSSTTASGLADRNRLLADRLLRGERVALAKAITLVESTRRQDQIQTSHLIGYLLSSAMHECAHRNSTNATANATSTNSNTSNTSNSDGSSRGGGGGAGGGGGGGSGGGDGDGAGISINEVQATDPASTVADHQAQTTADYRLFSQEYLISESSPVYLDPTIFSATEKQRELNANFRVKTFRIGISGPPGAGKSTFIEAFGKYLTSLGHKVAVVAVDPSSTVSGGSILGDKTRMIELARDPNAFIRPSPNRGSLGGVTTQTYEIMTLCECSGFDIIIVETVGVGQSEVQVADLTDMLLLLVPPAGGDELQGLKKGIVELSDLIVVNKADGNLLTAATTTQSEYAHALSVLAPKSLTRRRPQVTRCSSLLGTGIEHVWELVASFRASINVGEELRNKRRAQRKNWMWRHLNEEIIQRLYENETVKSELALLQDQVASGIVSPRAAADRIIDAFVRTTTRYDS